LLKLVMIAQVVIMTVQVFVTVMQKKTVLVSAVDLQK
jgi:hypothetical protein